MSRERFRQWSPAVSNHAIPSQPTFNNPLVMMTKEYYLDSPLLETCRFAINVENIQRKSLARIVASTRSHKVKHKQ
jgi:hypothetical protein